MPYLHTVEALDILQTRLESLLLEPANPDAGPLFQRVGKFGANQLVAAMKSVFASEQRVCFLVPGGDQHANQLSGTLLFSQRTTKVALLMADRMAGSSDGALVGGPHSLGILPMKDRVIDNLLAEPLAEADLAFAPGDGEPLVISDAEKSAGNLGRECWLQWLSCYAGSARLSIP